MKSKLTPGIAAIRRHAAALRFVLGTIVPTILKTRRRPVMFSRIGGMGDILSSIPAARELMKRHPGATFIYNCHADFAVVPKLGGIADQVTSLPEIGLIKYWYRFLFAGFYEFIHGDPLVVRTTVRDFCDQFGLPAHDDHPRLQVDSETRAKVESILSQSGLQNPPLIVFHAGPTMPVKEWPRENWVKLVAALREKGFTNIAQIGAGKYMPLGDVAIEPIPHAVSLFDALSVKEMMGVISRAQLYIGIDSGPMHFAAALGTPLVGIFGNTLPQYLYAEDKRRTFVVSGVECRGCAHYNATTPYTTDCPYHIHCMKTVGPDEVLAACLAHLETP